MIVASAARRELEELHALRAFAFLAVVLQHVIATLPWISREFAGELLPGTTLLIATRFAVPAFVFLAGFLAVSSLGRSGLGAWYTRRLRTVAIPYLFWTFFYYVYWKLKHGHSLVPSPEQLLQFATTLARGTAQYHLWFVVMILQIYLLAPLLVRIARAMRSGPGIAVGLAAGIAVHVGVVLQFDALGPYGYRLFPLWIFYAFAGAVAAVHYERLASFLKTNVGLGASGGLGAILFAGLSIQLTRVIDATTPYRTAADWSDLFQLHMLPLVVASTLAGLAIGLRAREGSWFTRSVRFISERSYFGYLAHPFAIALLTWRDDKERLDWAGDPLAIACAIFLAATVLTLLAAWLLDRAPRVVRTMVGARS